MLDLWPKLKVPVYATPFTAALLEAKRQGEYGVEEIPVTEMALGSRFNIGPFDIELVSVAHSIPESNALILRTPHGTVLHTGDWKLDATPVLGPPTDEAKLRALGAEGCHVLIGDSTNAVREGRSPSESDVARTLTELIVTAPRRVAVTTFASNVARIKAVADAARKAEREIVVVGRAMERVIGVARETGYLKGVQPFHGMDIFGHLPPDKVVALCTGSQGEARAALARIAQDEHPEVALSKGDRVIFSSRPIPGNEKAIGKVINGLIDQNIEVITDRTHLVHVSGHPRQAELEEMIGWVKPRTVIPVHGESLHLSEHAALARRLGARTLMIRNGDLVRLAPGDPSVIDEVPAGRLYKDGVAAGPGRGAHRCRPQAPELFRHDQRGDRDQRKGPAARRSGDRADRHSGKDRRRRVDGRHRLQRRGRDVRHAAEAAPPRSGFGRRGDPPRRPLRRRAALAEEAERHRACSDCLRDWEWPI